VSGEGGRGRRGKDGGDGWKLDRVGVGLAKRGKGGIAVDVGTDEVACGASRISTAQRGEGRE
jgi:hypothetical protein